MSSINDAVNEFVGAATGLSSEELIGRAREVPPSVLAKFFFEVSRMRDCMNQSKRSAHGSSTDDFEVPFGFHKGKKFSQLAAKDLRWYKRVLEESVEDSGKSRFKAKNQALLNFVNKCLEKAEETEEAGDDDGKLF